MRVSVTIDDARLKSSLKNIQTSIFTEKSFFYTILGFTRSHSSLLDDIEGFYQMIGGSYKCDKPINNTGIDKVHLKCNVVDGTIINGIREPILYSFVFSPSPAHKLNNQPRSKHFKRVNKAIFSHITFYFEDDDYKAVDFNGETISFTCQLIKIK